MIKYGLKLWSNNHSWFPEATRLIKDGQFNFIELYHNTCAPLYFNALGELKNSNIIGIHNSHDDGWHEFFVKDVLHLEQWKKTIELADFFKARHIVVHPSREHSLASFLENLALVNDPRIIVENMSGRDIDNQYMNCGQTLADLKEISTHKPICFDLEKAVKAANEQKLDYKSFIADCLRELKPTYFHISGGDMTAVDQHFNLWEAGFDVAWIKNQLESIAQTNDMFLLFEVPKTGEGLENDAKNLEWFKSISVIPTVATTQERSGGIA